MKLKPFGLSDETPSPIQAALKEAGILKEQESDKLNEAREALNANGASLEKAARSISEVLNTDDNGSKLRAAELVYKVNGVLKDAEKNQVPTFNFIFGAQENQNLTAFLTPRG